MTTETAEPVQTLAEHKAERFAPKAERLAPPKEEKEEPKGEVVAEAKEVEEVEPPEEPAAKKGNAKLQGRFSELTEQRRQAEQRAEREAERATTAERERDELKAKLDPPKKATDEAPQPRPQDYADAFQYAADLAEWTARKAVVEDRKEREEAATKEKAEAEAAKVKSAWNSRLAEAKKETTDWDDVVGSSDLSVSDPVRDAIIESDLGPQILYLLASEPERVEKLSGLSVLGQLREIGKMEARLEKPEAKETKIEVRPRAPAPITPVKGTKADNVVNDPGEFKGTFQEWKAQRQRSTH